MNFHVEYLIRPGGWIAVAVILGLPWVACAKPDQVSVKAVAPDSPRRWALTVGGPGSDTVDAVAIDAAGNVVIAGSFEDDLKLGSVSHTSAGDSDVYVAKFTSSGFYLWSKTFGSTSNEQITGMVVDRSGGVVFAGTFLTDLDFGDGPLVVQGGSDIFVTKLDSTGATVWSRAFGGSGLDDDARLSLDSDGNVVVSGEFSETMTVGTAKLTSAGATDIFLTRLAAADGTVFRAQSFGGDGGETARAMVVAPSGLTAVAGTFSGKLPIDSSPLTSNGASDAFVLKVSAKGP